MPPEIHPTANIYRSQIGDETKIAAFAEIGGAKVGRRCKIQAFAFLCPGVTLEDEVFIGPHVCFTNDRFPRAVGEWHLERTLVECGASIGAGSVILPGITIGAGAMVAAGSVVQTSIPAGYQFSGQSGAASLKRWYRSQSELELPYTFDEWRDRYDRLAYEEQRAFYDASFEKYPRQEHATLAEVERFFHHLPENETARVLEIGGWDGRVAGHMLHNGVSIAEWINLEVCQKAVAAGLTHPRYRAFVPDHFAWDLPELPAANIFFAAHTIEHIKAEQLRRLVSRLTTVHRAYVEAPLPTRGEEVSWAGRWNTHILELGWEEVERLFADFGFETIYRSPDVRWFSR